MTRLPACLLLALLASATGCGGNLTTGEGKITLDGKALEAASIVLHPVGKGEMATAVSDGNGGFTLRTRAKAGVRPGEYRVVVTKGPVVTGVKDLKPGHPEFDKAMNASQADTPESRALANYKDLTTSRLKVTVAAGTPLKIDLTSVTE